MYVLMKFIIHGRSDIEFASILHHVKRQARNLLQESKVWPKTRLLYGFLSQRESICFTRGES